MRISTSAIVSLAVVVATLESAATHVEAIDLFGWLRPAPEAAPATNPFGNAADKPVKPEQIDAWVQKLADLNSPAAAATLKDMSERSESWYESELDEAHRTAMRVALRKSLSSKSAEVRRRCIELLPSFYFSGDEDDIAAITPCLADDDYDLRLAATNWLRVGVGDWTKHKQTLALLWNNARTLDYRRTDYAVATIETLGAALQNPQHFTCWQLPVEEVPPTADDVWLNFACFVDSPLGEVRSAAFTTLSNAGIVPGELFPAAARGVRAKDPAVRAAAYQYLANWLDANRASLSQASIDEMWNCLEADLQRRSEQIPRDHLFVCAGALGEAARGAVPYLLEAMQKSNANPFDSSVTAAQSLARIDDSPQMIRRVTDGMLQHGESFRNAAALYFAGLPKQRRTSESAIGLGLTMLLQHDDADRRIAAVELILESDLPELHSAAIAEGLRLLQNPKQVDNYVGQVVQSVVKHGLDHDSGLRAVRQLLQHRNAQVRMYTLENFMYLGDEAVYLRYTADVVSAARYERNSEVRAFAQTVLKEWETTFTASFTP